MLTEDTLEPAPRFKLSRWLFCALMTWSLIFGAIGAIGVLFLADKSLFDTGHDPVVPNEEVQEQVIAVDQRLRTLEAKQDTSYLPNANDIAVLKNKLTTSIEETMQLRQQVAALQTGTQQDNRLARILMGITQLKAAYENDSSLQAGIATLQENIDNETIKKTLGELEKVSTENIPSKKVILENVRALQEPQKPAEDPNTKDMDLKSRAKMAFGKLVSIKATKDVNDARKATQIEHAVNANNFSLAASLAKELPKTPETVSLTSSLESRVKAQQLMQQLVFQVSKVSGQSGRGLY